MTSLGKGDLIGFGFFAFEWAGTYSGCGRRRSPNSGGVSPYRLAQPSFNSRPDLHCFNVSRGSA
jgi:hypothetical protein